MFLPGLLELVVEQAGVGQYAAQLCHSLALGPGRPQEGREYRPERVLSGRGEDDY